MNIEPLIERLKAPGDEVWIYGSVRGGAQAARKAKRLRPDLEWEQRDPVTGIPAYTEPTPGTATRIYLPPAPSSVESMGSATPPVTAGT